MAVPGTKLVVHAVGREAIEILLTSPDPRTVDELERRAELELRREKRRRAGLDVP